MQKNAKSMSLDEVRAWYLAEISKAVGYSNEEIFRNSCRIDSDYARMIYESFLSAPEDLKHYLRNEKARSRLLPAVLGSFSAKCALCGWDANLRSEIERALKSAEGMMFPMDELEGWVKTVEDKVRSCQAEHSGLEIWRFKPMLRLKVATPKVAKIQTAQYD